MRYFRKIRLYALALFCIPLLTAPIVAHAQTDEIQVYDAVITPPGIFNLMVHTNFTPEGRTKPAFPGAVIPNHSVNGSWEWAYGVKPWMEQGLYMPVYTPYSTKLGGLIDGFKVRELFVRPHAQQHKLFWGTNFEFSINYPYWDTRTNTVEVRPIIGAYLGRWEITYNPVVDSDYKGGLPGLEFNPGTRIVFNANHGNSNHVWDVAAEEYDGFGPFNNFDSLHNQFHEVWGVVDHNGKTWYVEAGAGLGLTAGSDRWTLKLQIARNLNKNPWRPSIHF